MAVQSADLRQIKGKLTLWDMRLRATQSLIWLPRGMVGGLIVALILAVVSRFRPLLDRASLTVLGIALPLIGGAAALLAVWLWRRSALSNARRFDQIFGLRERISTALELSQGALPIESDLIARRQVAQAAQVAGRVKAGKHLPLRLDWRWWAGLLAAALALTLALVIPNPQDQVLAQQAAVKAAITESLTKLEQLKSQALKDPGLTAAEKAAAVQSLDKAIQTLKQPDVSQQEALAALNNTQQELKNLSQQSAAQKQQALEGLSGLFSDTAAKDFADALANGDMQAAGQALQNLDPNNLTPDQQKSLGQALQSAAGQLADSNPQLSQQLGQAGQALQNGDAGEAQKQLGQAGQSIQQQGQQAQSGQSGQNGQSGQSGQNGQNGQNSQGGGDPNIQQYSDQVGQQGQNVAGAGKGGANQPGQNGMAQAPQQGQGSNQQQGQQGQGAGGAGRGEGNGAAQGGQENGQMSTNNGPGDGGEKPWENIFTPQRVGGQGGPNVDIPGTPDPGVPTGVEGDFANNPSGQSNVPYNQVWSDYASSVNQALESGYIPLGMRDLIKNYFSNLDPNKK
ncbi:MAG TPA: hypothetical protein VMF29_08220 [Candidatus Edwardsbacteria bacterium]|nr:hypothetical protein [Candidatus Edwardsbacteria bacterium]